MNTSRRDRAKRLLPLRGDLKMYTTNENKINNIVAGVTGSFLCEILCGDIKTIREFRKELKEVDTFKVYDQMFGTFNVKHLMLADALEEVRILLQGLNNLTKYKVIQQELKNKGISCCGYVETGRSITVYNSVAQLTIDCSKPTGPQLSNWLVKWG